MKKRKKGVLEKFSEKLIFLVITATGVYVPFFHGDSDPFEVYSLVTTKYDYHKIEGIIAFNSTLSIDKLDESNTQEIMNEEIEVIRHPASPPTNLNIRLN